MVSRQANMNITISSGVRGEVTLDLRDKNVDETLRIIAKLCHLAIQREQDVIYVSAEEDNLPIRVYHLKYVTSTDVQSMIQPMLSDKGKISISPQSEIGLKSDVVSSGGSGGSGGGSSGGGGGGGGGGGSQEVKAGGNSMAGGEIVIVQDYEERLKNDRSRHCRDRCRTHPGADRGSDR